jgi:hemoglobin/transferrin/lactoferrin receptor protein
LVLQLITATIMKKLVLFLLLTAIVRISFSQDTTRTDSASKELDEIIISFNRWEQKQNEVPNLIKKINRVDIFRNMPQTAADMLSQTGAVFVQKSQLGGGSPMIRGFATNRVLLVVDGVRMNNAIYRSGNLQNVISIDPLALETAEVVFGPGSLIYGSDAIGGVMDFHTLQPRLSENDKVRIKGSASARYSSANNENTVHADLNLGWKKLSVLSSVTYSKFDDLKMGNNGGQESYLRPEYVQRINNIDIIVKNTNPRIQRFSGYDQINYLSKIRFKPIKDLDMQYSFTHAATGDAPRYDRLIQYRNNQLRFAEWYYGPMIWSMHNFQFRYNKKTLLFDDIRITAAKQDYKESRTDRTRNSNNRNTQSETVKAFSFNTDIEKIIGKGKLFYGLEYVHNKVGSFGLRTNIASAVQTPSVSRYPNGSTWSTAAVYGSYKLNFHQQFTFTGGLRYSINSLKANFDTTFIKFPYQTINIQPGALTGNAGLVYRPNLSWQLNANISTGFRMPNVDDAGKLFESAPGNVTVPNPNLAAEYAWNFEIGFVKTIENKLRIETAVFHTILDNALVRRPDTFNGADSILFDGVMSRVESLQNAAKATVFGFQLSVDVTIVKHLSLITHANWITGRETGDVLNEQVPLRHAPPFYGTSFLRYKKEKLFAEVSCVYNSTISNANLAPVEQAKTEIYARDVNGKPYSPGWLVMNARTSYDVTKQMNISLSWENISNRRYRPYSSGIVASGSNLIASLRFQF